LLVEAVAQKEEFHKMLKASLPVVILAYELYLVLQVSIN
jgi:hypothetical protein